MSCIFLFLLILQFCVVVGLFNSSCFAEFMPKVELGKLRSLRLLLGKPTPTYQLHNGIKLFSERKFKSKVSWNVFYTALILQLLLINNILLTESSSQLWNFNIHNCILQNLFQLVKKKFFPKNQLMKLCLTFKMELAMEKHIWH